MKSFYSLFIVAAIALSANSFAQKVEDMPCEFNYVQLPETPFDASITGYQGQVVQSHESRVAEMQAAVEQDKQQAEYDYQQGLAAWEQAKMQVDMEYEEAMNAYNNKSAGDKILESAFLNEGKPVRKPYPPAPMKRIVVDPYFPKIYNEGSISSFASIEGMKANTGSDVIITITMDGFEVGGVENRTKTTERKDAKTGQVIKTVQFWKEVSYKHGMAVKVESPATGVVMDEYIQEFTNFNTKTTQMYKSQYEADNYWRMNEKSFLNQLDDEITMNQLKFIKTLLDERYGFLTKERNTIVRTVKTKKFDYSDFQEAYEHALVGYNAIERGGMEKTEAKENLNKSCEIWETVINEFDPNMKKARIDEKQVIAARMNLIEAYIFMDEYDKAKLHYNKLIAMGNKRVKRDADVLNDFLEVQKLRYNANAG